MSAVVIGGATTSGGTIAPHGAKLFVGGSCSTGSYATTLTAGDYLFQGGAGSSVTLADGTVIRGDNNFANNSFTVQSASPVYSAQFGTPSHTGTFFRVPGTQAATVTTGAAPFSKRLGSRTSYTGAGAASSIGWNRNKVSYLAGKYVFPDQSTNSVWTSTDGLNFTSTATTFAIGNCFTVANGMLFAGDTANSNNLYYSTNGTTFTQVTLPTANIADGRLHAVLYIGTTYVAFVRRASGNLNAVHTFTSTNGTTWTYGAAASAVTVANASYDLYVASSGSAIVYAGDGSVNGPSAVYSTNGTTWSSVPTSITSYVGALEYSNGYFMLGNCTPSGSNTSPTLYYTATPSSGWSTNSWGTNYGYFNNANIMYSGMYFDGTNAFFTISYNNQASQSYGGFYAFSGVMLGGAITSFALLAQTAFVQSGYSPKQYDYFTCLSVANGKFFVGGSDPHMNLGAVAFNCGTSLVSPNAPGSFNIFKYYESTVLN